MHSKNGMIAPDVQEAQSVSPAQESKELSAEYTSPEVCDN
jgi:hypothetical protein